MMSHMAKQGREGRFCLLRHHAVELHQSSSHASTLFSCKQLACCKIPPLLAACKSMIFNLMPLWPHMSRQSGGQDEGQDLVEHRELHSHEPTVGSWEDSRDGPHADAVASHRAEDHEVKFAEAQQPPALRP